MSQWTPCKRRDFVRKLRKLGFEGPFSGKRHQFMVYEDHRLAIPNVAEYSVPQLRMLLKEVEGTLDREVPLEEWLELH